GDRRGGNLGAADPRPYLRAMMTPHMPVELLVLTLAALLQCVQFGLMSLSANLDVGPKRTMSPRDPQRLGKPLAEMLGVKSGRLYRAFNNMFEALILFTIAALVITLTGQSTIVTQSAAWIFLAARIAYIPAYYFGLAPGRSVIWIIGFLATLTLLIAALF
ncbi:MAG: MAPEG family protein, partial [Pararhodobacter sp.]